MQTQLWIFHRNLDSLGDHGATVFFFSCFRRTRLRHQVEVCKVDLCEDGVSYEIQVVILRPVTYVDILCLMKFSLEGTNNLTSTCSFSFFSVLQKQPPVQLQARNLFPWTCLSLVTLPLSFSWQRSAGPEALLLRAKDGEVIPAQKADHMAIP